MARALLALLAPAEDRSFVVRDLERGYAQRREGAGRLSAWWWYWWQVLRAVPAWWSERREAGLSGMGGGGSVRMDTRFALRSFRRRPVYAAGVVCTLGLGLGAAAAMVAIADGIWFSPLPIPDEARLVRVYEVNLRGEGTDERALLSTSAAVSAPARWNRISPPLLSDFQAAQLSTIEHVGAISPGHFDWVEGTEVRRISAHLVSPEVFGMLGVRVQAGRTPRAGPGLREVALTSGFWQRSFGGVAGVIGRDAMMLDGESYAIVGVIEAPSGYPAAADVWVPLHFEASALAEGMRGARYLEAVAQLRAGRTAAEASAELDGLVKRLAEQHPMQRGWGGYVIPLRDDLVRPFRSVLLVLLVAGAAFVLLAVVNVAGLVAARRADNRHARAVRLALGASPAQIVRAGVVESTLLGVAAAMVAGLGAFWVLAPIKRLIPSDVPRMSEISIGAGILGGLALAGIAAGVLVGFLGHLMSGVRDRPAIGRNRDAERPGVRGRRALLITQVALTTWLLVSGVALTRYVHELRSVEVGFRPQGALAAPISLSPQRQASSKERALLFWRDVLRGLEARGIDAAVANNPPVSGSSMRYGYALDGATSQAWGQYHAISNAYFDVLGIDLIAGRPFTELDGADGPPVVIINEALARAHFGETNAVGRSLNLIGTRREIVGVARSTRHFGPDQDAPPEMYVPLAQDPPFFGHVLVRATDGVDSGVLGQVIAPLDAQMLVPPLAPFDQYIRNWFAPFRLQLVVLGAFAVVAALLVALGVYALVAYVVSSREREMGIRVALGERTDVLFRRILGQGLALTSIGASVGIVAAVATSALVRRLIEGVDPLDPLVLLTVAALVTTIAVLASAVPARRAVRVDPIVTLRSE